MSEKLYLKYVDFIFQKKKELHLIMHWRRNFEFQLMFKSMGMKLNVNKKINSNILQITYFSWTKCCIFSCTLNKYLLKKWIIQLNFLLHCSQNKNVFLVEFLYWYFRRIKIIFIYFLLTYLFICKIKFIVHACTSCNFRQNVNQ